MDDAQQLVVSARLIRDCGAKKIYLVATHGLFSGDTPELLQNSEFDEVGKIPSMFISSYI